MGSYWYATGKSTGWVRPTRCVIPSGVEVVQARIVTPGFIDAHSVVGLAGALNSPHDQDQLERSNPFQPELRAIDAYNAREHLVVYVSDQGITTLHTGHGPGAIASGQTMIVKTSGETVNEALVDSVTMVAFTLGPSGEPELQPGRLAFAHHRHASGGIYQSPGV